MKIGLGKLLAGLCGAFQVGATLAATPTEAELVSALELEPHVEGGYFRRTYAAENHPRVLTPEGERYSLTSIFYLLTQSAPTGHFHRNRSDIVHYFQLGDAITYYLIYPDGHLETVIMGTDVTQGEVLQLTVPGGVWKASSLNPGAIGYGLISEAVSPGFEYTDMTLGDRKTLAEKFPQHEALFESLSHP